ncbi:Trm112 family protein [Aliiglaciecola sp. CAU 1673]|uniref:Trm112 family protein n=1 Tax=Aliiglaciecola sp. CAU 1673 TaxID=3032595 RepID=UPI0023DC1A62|nr:Trm112 family protein [Aliiglaciecola sp. CAU 1673]MDF2179984.1 Trm112 family protein [Aliiglaciecola sp. CAU 1673]
MAFDKKLLDILACPVCKGKLDLDNQAQMLICRFDRLAYPIRDGIPVMLENEAKSLSLEELEAHKAGSKVEHLGAGSSGAGA